MAFFIFLYRDGNGTFFTQKLHHCVSTVDIGYKWNAPLLLGCVDVDALWSMTLLRIRSVLEEKSAKCWHDRSMTPGFRLLPEKKKSVVEKVTLLVWVRFTNCDASSSGLMSARVWNHTHFTHTRGAERDRAHCKKSAGVFPLNFLNESVDRVVCRISHSAVIQWRRSRTFSLYISCAVCHIQKLLTQRLNEDIRKVRSYWAFYLKAHLVGLGTFSRKKQHCYHFFCTKKQDNTKILILNLNTVVGVLSECIWQTITFYNSLVI